MIYFTAELLNADFKTTPFDHQLCEFEQSCGLKARALLWSMRSGKSKLLIDTACHLASVDEIDAVLLFAPNGIHDNWIRRELPVHHWDSVERDTLVWKTAIAGKGAKHRPKGWDEQHKAWWSRAKRLIKGDKLAWFAFNSETMTRKEVRQIIARIMRHRRCLVIFDESDDFRTPGSTRTKMARALKRRCPYRRIATASVVTNSPLAAYSQFELLEDNALGFQNYGEFKERYAVYKREKNRKGQTYDKLDRYINIEELRDKMAPWSSVIRREDIKDMPDLVKRVVPIELTDEQVRIYRDLHSKLRIQVGNDEVSIGEMSSRIAKLQQVVSGFLIDEYGDLFRIPGENPRLEALADEVYLASGKVLVWCRFRHDIDLVSERLRADGHKIVEYHGRIGDEERVQALDLLRNDPDTKALVGQPQAGGRGLNMATADHVFHYTHLLGHAIVREQSDERATEIGGLNVDLADFVARGVDEYAMELFADKFNMADDLARTGMLGVIDRIRI